MSSAVGPLSDTAEPDAEIPGAAGEPCAPPSVDELLRTLGRLAGVGLEMALVIERRVKAAEPDQPVAELNAAAMAYARVSRSVRLAVLLQAELMKGRDGPPQASEAAASEAEALHRKQHIERAVRVVRRVARDHCRKDGYAVSAIAREAAERLDDDDIYGLVATRPVGELVAMLCRDFGLEPDWSHLAAEAWAKAEIESGAEGSPFLDDDDEDEEPAEADPPPVRPAFRRETYQEKLAALARDPAILAVAARRDSG